MQSPNRFRQRGAAALAVTLLLLSVMVLGAAFVHRGLIVEQRAAAHQYAAVQAFEAAEAGLQWAEAQLNANRRLGADCLPTADPLADSFRERFLRLDGATGALQPRRAAGTASAGCVRTATGFACSCPPSGAATLVRPAGDGPFATFRVEFVAADLPGRVRVVATGCSTAAPPCLDAGSARSDATARVEVTLGLLGALRVPPTARLIAGGRVDGATLVFPGASAAVRSGGPVTVGGSARVQIDASFVVLPAERFFAATFGLDRPRWKEQAAVARVDCRTDCAAALLEATRDGGAGTILHVDGDLELAGPVVLGSTARPVLVVVDGAARLRGAVELHGALYAASIAWDGAGPGAGAAVHGALIAERDYRGDAAVALQDDPTVLATLTRLAGSFARVNGSWRDF